MLLAELSQFTTGSIEAKFLMDSWNQYSFSVSISASSPLVQILVVVGNLARNLSKVAMQDIKGER